MKKIMYNKKHEIIVKLIINYEKKTYIDNKNLNDKDIELDENKIIYILH